MIDPDLTPAELALAAAEGARLAARRSAELPAQDEQPKVAPKVHEPVKARNMTLIAIHHLEIEGRVFHHAAEIMPSLISSATLAKLIDQGRVREYDSRDRRSLYRLFSRFSGCEDTEFLSDVERTAYALPP